jgi:HK97 family phage prohead protease
VSGKQKWYIKSGAPGFAVVDEVKSDDGKGPPVLKLTGYASRFGEIDDGNDRAKPGAFRYVKAPLPLLYQHRYKEYPPIGVVDWVGEDAEGWLFTAQIPTDTQRGYEMSRLLEIGSLSGISYGYDPLKTKNVYIGGKQVRDLLLLSVIEVSIVLWPMLKSARVLSWTDKSADVLRDRVTVAKYDYCLAHGIEPHPGHVKDSLDALGREIERLQYDGMTWQEWAAQQMREVGQMLRELEAVAVP